MRKYVIDFESFYRDRNQAKKDGGSIVSIQEGVYPYLDHPEFEAYMVSIVEIVKGKSRKKSNPTFQDPHTGDFHHLVTHFVGHPDDAPFEMLAGQHVFAHNIGFDRPVFERVETKHRPARWSCSASMAAYMRLPRNLAGACKEGLGKEVSKGMREWANGRSFLSMLDDVDKYTQMLEYCLDDSALVGELVIKYYSRWPEEEDRVATLTAEQAIYGIEMAWPKVKKAIQHLNQKKWEYEEQLPWVQDGGKPLSPKALAQTCRDNGIEPPKSMDKTKPYLDKWLDQYGEQFPWVASMGKWRSCNTLLKKLETFRDRRSGNNKRVDFGFKYCAAHTNRWGGDSKTNVQALHKDKVEGVDLRSMIVAPRGKKFLVADYSQIEPRVLAYLIDDFEFLELVSDGMSPYEAHARATMGWTKAEPLKTGDPKLYALAKARVLGLGYGCGAKTFINVARVMAGLTLSFREAKNIVMDFKRTNPKIVQFWKDLDRDFAAASRSKNRFFEITLPSGTALKYYEVTRRGDRKLAITERGGYHKDFWGGKLCENLVQATARDVLRDALIRLDDAGHQTVWHVHDEVILEVPNKFTKNSEREFLDLMNQTPEWLGDCPIEVEHQFTPHYLK